METVTRCNSFDPTDTCAASGSKPRRGEGDDHVIYLRRIRRSRRARKRKRSLHTCHRRKNWINNRPPETGGLIRTESGDPRAKGSLNNYRDSGEDSRGCRLLRCGHDCNL